MSRKDFVPKQDALFLALLDKMKAGLALHGTTLGFTAAEITAFNTQTTTCHTTFSAADAAKAAAESATNTKNLSRVPMEALVRSIANRSKHSPAYDPAKGAALGIIGPEDSTDLHTTVPEIKGRDKSGGHVELQFTKSKSDGVNIYSKRGAETGFTFLARDTQSPYIDTRPLLDPTKPEVRIYKMKYVVADEEVSDFSEDLEINCAP
jgi:hypothetical protein